MIHDCLGVSNTVTADTLCQDFSEIFVVNHHIRFIPIALSVTVCVCVCVCSLPSLCGQHIPEGSTLQSK